MKILYVGETNRGTTSGQRFEALKRLGHDLVGLNLYQNFKRQITGKLQGYINHRTGYRLLQWKVLHLINRFKYENDIKPDLVWVNSGEILGRRAVRTLREYGVPIALYNNDDPTSGRDGRRWDSLFQALPDYDFCAVRLDSETNTLLRMGARRIMPVWMSYDEVAHAPNPSWVESKTVDVGFVGTWMRGEHREELLSLLYSAGIKVSITGSRWEKCPNSVVVNECWTGSAASGLQYVDAISCPKLTLGLVSKTNNDNHTQRSLEIPYAGGILFAERTEDHLRLYREDEEAVFWGSTDECIEKCHWLLNHPEKRKSIRAAGMSRVRDLGLGNESVCQGILDACLGGADLISSMPIPLNEI